jgi:hypothetical protein
MSTAGAAVNRLTGDWTAILEHAAAIVRGYDTEVTLRQRSTGW